MRGDRMWDFAETVQAAIALLIILFFLSVGALGASWTEGESLKMGKSRKNKGRRQAPKKEKEKVMEVIEHGKQFIHPRVVLDQTAYHKIMHWVNKADGEVSGLGKIENQEDGTFRVTSVMLLPQKNTGASTELDGQAVAKAMYELKDVPGHLNYWWHSHVNMAAFWSKTDTDTMKEFADGGGTGGWCVATVFNKKRETKSAFCMAAPFETPIRVLIDDIPMEVQTFLPNEVFAAWDAEYDKNCKKEPVTSYLPTHHGTYQSRKSIWDNKPDEYDIRDGWASRFSGLDQEYRRIPVNEFGQFCTRITFDIGKPIPPSFWEDDTIVWMGPRLRETPHPKHPKVAGNVITLPSKIDKTEREVDIPALRDLVKRCGTYAEFVALEDTLQEHEVDALYRLPEAEALLRQVDIQEWMFGGGYN